MTKHKKYKEYIFSAGMPPPRKANVPSGGLTAPVAGAPGRCQGAGLDGYFVRLSGVEVRLVPRWHSGGPRTYGDDNTGQALVSLPGFQSNIVTHPGSW